MRCPHVNPGGARQGVRGTAQWGSSSMTTVCSMRNPSGQCFCVWCHNVAGSRPRGDASTNWRDLEHNPHPTAKLAHLCNNDMSWRVPLLRGPLTTEPARVIAFASGAIGRFEERTRTWHPAQIVAARRHNGRTARPRTP